MSSEQLRQTELAVIEMGLVPYAEAERLQRTLVRRRQADEIGDVLVLLEHPPVITLGRNAKTANLLRTRAELARLGVAVAECDRGGDVTAHEPGQLVGYPIFDLRGCGRPAFLPPRAGGISRIELGPVDFVRALEEILIRTLAECGALTQRVPGRTGVWTIGEASQGGAAGARKLAAIGIHVSRGVTSHGFALNVNNDMAGFGLIIPCGIADRGVSSLALETGEPWTPARVRPRLVRHFQEIFGRKLAEVPVSWDDKTL